MSLPTVARHFGLSLIVIGVAMLAPAAFAIATGEKTGGNYAFGAAFTVFIGAGLTLLSPARGVPVDLRSTLFLILLWWTAAPLFGALPLWLDGWSLIDGYFDIVAALTTTGATLEGVQLFYKPVDLLWRAVLQWVGGLASLAIAAAIFIRPAFTGADTIIPSFRRGESNSYAHAVGSAARSFAGVYALVTLVAFSMLAMTNIEMLDAAVLSLSTVASGGLVPRAEGLNGYAPSIALILTPFVLLSGLNFTLLDRNARNFGAAAPDSEAATYIVLIACVAALMTLFAGLGEFPAPIFNAMSLFATNGAWIGEKPGLIFALVTVIIGGSAVSTAGGLKILRWIIVMRRTRLELARLISPNAVFGPKPSANELGVWMHFLVFTIVLALLTAALTAGGHSFEISAAGAVGALANAAPVLKLSVGGEEGYRLFDDAAVRLILAAGMILGRLEGVAALMLINRAFWRA